MTTPYGARRAAGRPRAGEWRPAVPRQGRLGGDHCDRTCARSGSFHGRAHHRRAGPGFSRLLTSGGLPEGSQAQIDLVAALEDLKSGACGIRVEATVAFDAARRSEQAAQGVPARRQGRGVASEVALARKESPHRGQVLVGLAKVLKAEMPHALQRLKAGDLNEFRTILLARETAC